MLFKVKDLVIVLPGTPDQSSVSLKVYPSPLGFRLPMCTFIASSGFLTVEYRYINPFIDSPVEFGNTLPIPQLSPFDAAFPDAP